METRSLTGSLNLGSRAAHLTLQDAADSFFWVHA